MGQKLKEYYSYVKRKGGLQAQLRLAMLTRIPSTKAETVPDSFENISIFDKAFQEITGMSLQQFKTSLLSLV